MTLPPPLPPQHPPSLELFPISRKNDFFRSTRPRGGVPGSALSKSRTTVRAHWKEHHTACSISISISFLNEIEGPQKRRFAELCLSFAF